LDFRPILALALALPVACSPAPAPRDRAQPAPSPPGVLVGTVGYLPGCPAESAAEDCRPEPAAGARLLVRRLDGGEPVRVAADAAGEISLELPPGRYRVELEPQGVELSKDLPAEVEIHAGQETRLEVRIDRGIR
jgi:hypothetical protein